jgi:hypothetical protein
MADDDTADAVSAAGTVGGVTSTVGAGVAAETERDWVEIFPAASNAETL